MELIEPTDKLKGISTAADTIADMGDKKSIDKLIEKRRGLFIVS